MFLSMSGGVVLALLVLIVAVYALSAYPLYRIAKSTSDRGGDAYMAWIPILNLILMCRIGGVNPWTALVLLLSVVPLLGSLVTFVYTLVLWVKIGQRFNRTGLAVLAGLLPILGAWFFAFRITPERAGY
jgi:hypothetical protein